jgi:ATP-dependent Lon protease
MMKKAGTVNPLILLDEVDKMSMDFRGDPAAALLEVLDPEQNHCFQDHYLDVEYDLSNVMFIATANVLHTMPQALQDRVEVLRLPGYTEEEKLEIAKRFLVAKQMEANGLKRKPVRIQDDSLKEIIQRYTREAGVRNLEREIASVCRKIARQLVTEGVEKTIEVTGESTKDYLGVPRFRPRKTEGKSEVGIATGLAWTEVGGELLITEASLMYGKGGLTLTGKLGDVMRESATTALSFIRSRAEDLGIARDFNRRIDVHIHVPEGSIPKDGPSAGITMCTALISALNKIPVRSDVAMTGEITLRGKVLPIGGVKEKILAAHRAGINNIILPRDNEKDLPDIPENVLRELNIMLVEEMDEVLEGALSTPINRKASDSEPEESEEPNEPRKLEEGIQGESIAH